MRKPNILVTEPEYFTERSLERMGSCGNVTAKRMSRKALLGIIPKIDILVVRIETEVDRELLAKAKDLKLVVTATTGLNHIDTARLKARGVKLVSLHGTHTVSTAEHALALLFAAARNIPKAHAALSKGRWRRWEHIGVQLHGKTMGIYGIGRIGARVAALAKGLGMDAIAYDPHVNSAEIARRGAKKASWDAFVKGSDFFSLHAPLTDGTRHAFGKSAFGKMKHGAIIVNTARGEIIEEKALLRALAKRRLAAAAIDVYPKEPLSPRSPLVRYARKCGNLIITPHLGASTREAVNDASMAAANAVVDGWRMLTGTARGQRQRRRPAAR